LGLEGFGRVGVRGFLVVWGFEVVWGFDDFFFVKIIL
jgi:hypothetical protein